jgi:hypothetical protein
MKYGIREVCDMDFYKYGATGPSEEISFTIDSAKTSTLEGASTTVYAQGGRGNSRLMAWEGERTITFTVEDALFSKKSLAALLGTDADESGTIHITEHDFAGMYQIVAKTLVRNENNIDEEATITIHKAKLQSNFNIAMSPSGDPSAFTFTFDAFPVNDEFLTIQCHHFESDATATTTTTITIIDTDGKKYSATKTGANSVALSYAEGGSVTFGGTAISGLALTAATEELVSSGFIVKAGQEITVPAGSSTTWYVV